jgi:hypothetical protein
MTRKLNQLLSSVFSILCTSGRLITIIGRNKYNKIKVLYNSHLSSFTLKVFIDVLMIVTVNPNNR